MKQIVKLLAVAALIIGVAGCAHRTAYQTDIHSVVASGHTVEQVRSAIIKAGKARHWVMNDDGAGVIVARLITRSHTATVRIPYNATSYSIDYDSSSNLRARDGRIHRNYLRWVTNLDRDIQLNLSAQ